MCLQAPCRSTTPTTRETQTPGRLYRYDTDLSVRLRRRGSGAAPTASGTASTTIRCTTSIPTPTSIDAYDYDINTGDIANRRKLAPVQAPLVPDGQTVDEEGCIWLAVWEGGCVKRFSPNGELLQTIELPTARTTSVMFGGPDLDEIYVTSAGGDDKANRGPHAGALFRIRAGVKGRPENLSRLGL
ncbi:MAG: SMP-30/gluconolactonase/LRE family protein [Phycisphaerales bacterium]